MPEPTTHAITSLLTRWTEGSQEALEQLIPLLYQELRQLAHRHIRQERSPGTLQSTALVHEAYLRFAKQGLPTVENRRHFIGVASRLMRQILVDHARERNAAKRDGGLRVEMDESFLGPNSIDIDVIALDGALTELEKLDPRQCRIIELRFFGGLSVEETAACLGVSTATVKRQWSTARAWLSRELAGTSG